MKIYHFRDSVNPSSCYYELENKDYPPLPFESNLKNIEYRKKVLRFYNNQCFICGYRYFLAIHHIIPKRKGGNDRIDNLIVLCPNHHKEWHYYERTFLMPCHEAINLHSMSQRTDKAIEMDWEIPEFCLHNNISPMFIQFNKWIMKQMENHDQ